MAEDEPTMYKFPRTPHISGSKVVDDDEVVSSSGMAATWRTEAARGWRVVVQEKVDGANVGVHFSGGEETMWEPVCQKRGGVIGQGEKHAQYPAFRSWCVEHAQELWKLLGSDRVLFGEWLWARHSVHYDSLPGDFFVAFDILEKRTGRFLSHARLIAEVNSHCSALNIVPLLWEGSAAEASKASNGDVSLWLRKLAAAKSSFGSETAEGVYVRVEDSQSVLERFKLRRDTFVAGRSDFSSSVKRNTLK